MVRDYQRGRYYGSTRARESPLTKEYIAPEEYGIVGVKKKNAPGHICTTH
jgi:hypothetical protein